MLEMGELIDFQFCDQSNQCKRCCKGFRTKRTL